MRVQSLRSVEIGDRQVRLQAEPIVARVRAKLEQGGIFDVPAADRPVARADLQVEPVLADEAGAELGMSVRLRISVRPLAASYNRFLEDSAGFGQVSLDAVAGHDPSVGFQRLAEQTAEDLAASYVNRQKLWSADAGVLAGALAGSDPEARVEALRVIGARNLRQHADAILQLLGDQDETIRDAALGTLVALRERRAVGVLARERAMRDAREMRKILDAIAVLGGDEAEDYLSFVAEAHEAEEIRAMAREALSRMDRRQLARPTK